MKKCPKCGTILDDSKKKCYMCGTQLTNSANNFGDTFDAQIGASISGSSNNAFANDDFLFNNNSNVDNNMDNSDNAFFGMGMDKLNSMEYDERSSIKKSFDSVFKSGDSFKSKDDELKKAEEAEAKRKQQEEAERLKQEEKERLAKEKQLKKERDKERQVHEKAEKERVKAERDAALKAEREQKEKERLEKAEQLRKEKEEKDRLLKEQKAKEAEELKRKKENEKQLLIAQNEEKKRLELEATQKREAELELKKQEKALLQQEQREKAKQLEEEKRIKKEAEQQERMRQQEEQAILMKAQRDEAFNKKYQIEKKIEEKPSINWGEGLVDSSVDDYKDKVNKVNKKKSLTGVFNFLSVLIFIGLVGFGYFKFVKPNFDTNKEIGQLSYVINKDFKLSNKADDNRYYSYGESCGLRLSYGPTNDVNGFVDNYFNDIKTQYESDMNSFTEKSSLKINGNVWSELSVIYLEDVADLSKKENIVKYRYVSIVYDGKYYHTVFVNPNNDKKCYDMYEEFIQSMEFDKKR